jgi:large subunit ribosomal protein L27
MAHTASVGSAKRTVDVAGKRLGIKKYGSQFVKPGNIIMRQRGSTFHPGKGVKMGKDFTIYAVEYGYVNFRNMTGFKRGQKLIDVLTLDEFVKIKPNFGKNNIASKSNKVTPKVKKVESVESVAMIDSPKKTVKKEVPKRSKVNTSGTKMAKSKAKKTKDV